MPFDGSELGRIIEEMIIAAIPIGSLLDYQRALARSYHDGSPPYRSVRWFYSNIMAAGAIELRKRNQQAA